MSSTPTSLIVCPTSHMDWDWIGTFEEYYKIGPSDSQFGSSATKGAVQHALSNAFTLMTATPPSPFSLAELGWLQRFLIDRAGSGPPAAALADQFQLLGGGITSPDDIVCNGEVFVRNYLLGRQWIADLGLSESLVNVCWVPDSFGHDAELPVILQAMGLSAVGFARCPGAFPNFNSPTTGEASMACQLMSQGVVFTWQGSDGSQVRAHFMPDTYGVPQESGTAEQNAYTWADFVDSTFLSKYPVSFRPSAVNWPGDVAFAPAGGDFSIPTTAWQDGVLGFNDNVDGTVAQLGSFQGYLEALEDVPLDSQTLDPTNFWTGFFASRPELKLNQNRAARALVAAEVASSLLRIGSLTSSARLDALDGLIQQTWAALVPSSHHDFITGTAPDRTYKMEQLPMVTTAARVAEDLAQETVQQLADLIVLDPPAPSSRVVAVFNSLGFGRNGVFELTAEERVGSSSVTTTDQQSLAIQELPGGGLLAEARPAGDTVPSMGWSTCLLTAGAAGSATAPQEIGDFVTLDNGTVSITLAKQANWTLVGMSLDGGSNLLSDEQIANEIRIYQDEGSIYKFGMEPGGLGWTLQDGALSAGSAVQLEFGPLRWRVIATLIDNATGDTFQLTYSLIKGESLVRMSLTGKAPSRTSVVAAFPAVATDGTSATHLTYGTPHHWHEDAAPPYWSGPTFKPTHDFLLPTADTAGMTFPLAAVYHGGVPAWACAAGSGGQGEILGCLLRNTPGTQNGACGTDSDEHTVSYALRVSSEALDPSSGTPLAEALAFSHPLRVAVAQPANAPEAPVTVGPSGSLASTDSGMLRVARPQGEIPGPPATRPNEQPVAGCALRLYRADADGSALDVALTLGALGDQQTVESAELVSALEDPIQGAPDVAVSTNVLTVPTSQALTTVQVRVQRPPTSLTNGCM